MVNKKRLIVNTNVASVAQTVDKFCTGVMKYFFAVKCLVGSYFYSLIRLDVQKLMKILVLSVIICLWVEN